MYIINFVKDQIMQDDYRFRTSIELTVI